MVLGTSTQLPQRDDAWCAIKIPKTCAASAMYASTSRMGKISLWCTMTDACMCFYLMTDDWRLCFCVNDPSVQCFHFCYKYTCYKWLENLEKVIIFRKLYLFGTSRDCCPFLRTCAFSINRATNHDNSLDISFLRGFCHNIKRPLRDFNGFLGQAVKG